MRQDVFFRLAVQHIPVVIRSVDGFNPVASRVHYLTPYGPSCHTLAINIVARHMVNILMHIPGLICFSECPCMSLSEKTKVLHLISTLTFLELRRGVSLGEHLNHIQPGKHNPPSKPSVTSTLA